MPWEKTENEIRHRLQDPDLFDPESFRTKDIAPGVNLILGRKTGGNGSLEAQAVRFDKDKFTLAEAKKWMKGRKFSEDEESAMETYNIRERVIFSTGVHNGDRYDLADLKEMERAFNECKGMLRPPLKLGHNDEQLLIAADGLPACGWIDNVRAIGNDLVADFVKMPRAIYELVLAGAYATTSAEIYWNFVCGDKKYPYALKAVALLGADIPAVKSVSDIMALYSAECAAAYKEIGEFETHKYDGQTAEESTKMDEIKSDTKIEAAAPVVEPVKPEAVKPDLEARIASLEKVIADAAATFAAKKDAYKKTITELTEKLTVTEAKYAEAQAAITKADSEKRHADISAKVDSLISGKRLLPAQKPAVLKLLSELPLDKKYKEGEAEKSIEELIFSVFQSNPEVSLNTEQATEAGAKQQDEVAQIKQIQSEQKCSYKEAYLVWKRKNNK